MPIIHATDPTTKVLSYLYGQRHDISAFVTESSTNGDVKRAIRGDDTIMMLGHGNQYGLFSKPNKNGDFKRFLITDRHVQFLREKTCIGIWCYANVFAERYGLHGLFSGMIISELQEAIDCNMERFTRRLNDCINRFGLAETAIRMRSQDDVKSELTIFNYNNLYYYE